MEKSPQKALFPILVILSCLIYLLTDKASYLYLYLNWLLTIVFVSIFSVQIVVTIKRYKKIDYLSIAGVIASISLLIVALSVSK